MGPCQGKAIVSDPSGKMVAVTGATGLQGGAVVAQLLKTKYKIRAITRNASSAKAEELKAKGCEVVEADFDKPETLQAAFEGCQDAFLVTNFWEHLDVKREVQQGKALADACIAAKVQHVVWSMLSDTRDQQDEIPMIGEYKVPHIDGKAEVSKYLDENCGKGLTVTHLHTVFYYENFITTMKPSKQDPNGPKTIVVPIGTSAIPCVAVDDIGKAAVFCLQRRINGIYHIASQKLTGEQMASIISEAIGEQVVHYAPEPAQFREFGFPGCKDLGNMFEWKVVHNDHFNGLFDYNKIRKQDNIDLIDFKSFCMKHKDQIKN